MQTKPISAQHRPRIYGIVLRYEALRADKECAEWLAIAFGMNLVGWLVVLLGANNMPTYVPIAVALVVNAFLLLVARRTTRKSGEGIKGLDDELGNLVWRSRGS